MAQGNPTINKVIYINGRFLSQSVTGVQRYALEVLKGLDNLCEQGAIDLERYRIILLAPQQCQSPGLRHITLLNKGRLSGHLWEQIELPFYVTGGILFNPCNTAPLILSNQVVTIHDASVFGFPRAYSTVFRLWYKVLLKILSRKAKIIVTVSDFSRRELIQYCGLENGKIMVIPEGKEHILRLTADSSILRRHGLEGRCYILSVSSMNPNKNFAAILKAYELLDDLDFDIAIAGGNNPKVYGQVTIPASPRVKLLGYVSDSERKALYEHASCFVFPSFYEGFGLPPLEAMACGCPVVVSRTSSLPEVFGDACLYCDPGNPQDIAEQIRTVIVNEAKRRTMRENGMVRSSLFCWNKCASQTLEVLKEAAL